MSLAMNESEHAQYLELGGERIYTVRYAAETPQAWVLLCGPFPSDRLYSLAAWAKWGRYLANRGLAAIRFDYSGTGESTGRFADMDFLRWQGDIERSYDRLAGQAGDLPVFLHGLGLGGLLAQQAFSAGRGDGLLMWSPPAHGLDVLKQGLMIRLSMDMLLQRAADRKTAKDYIDQLQAGGTVQIDGYAWSSGLWSTGERMSLAPAMAAPGEGTDGPGGRPWRHLVLDDRLSPLVKSQSMLRAMNPRAAVVPSAPLNRDFGTFFEANAEWLRGAARARRGAERHA
jgi:alpha/beta superfamily hydrolase